MLKPILDSSRLLRVDGRICNPSLSYDRLHPVIIPKGHFIQLYIKQLHDYYYHANRGVIKSHLSTR